MVRFPRRFSTRLSAVFLILLALMAVVHVSFAIRSFERHQVEVDQRVNAGLAEAMAKEIEPLLLQGETPSGVEPIIHYMMVMNPAVEIYLLDGGGDILAFFAQPGKQVRQERVDTEPIEAFLARERTFPIYGDDPRHPGQRKHFSASRIPLGEGRTGYLYIVLRSSLYETAESLLQRGFLFAALRDSLLIALPVVGLLGLAIFFFSTRRLERLTRTVRAFGAGDYSRRAGASSRDEIGELADAFNRMADTIVSNVERIREADRERRELIANISHDLRNPLATIQGYLETLSLREGSISEQERRQFLSVAQNGTAVLRRLIEQLFELSKLDSAEARPRMERFSLGELVQDVVMQMRPEADRTGVTLSARPPEALYFVEADIGMIERLLTNLIDNAIRHTPEGGDVRVELEQRDGRTSVLVRDTGCGIPEEDLPRIFDRFYIGDRSRSRFRTGSGLGLAIAKRIVDLHGGSIGAESVAGAGSTFRFELPEGG